MGEGPSYNILNLQSAVTSATPGQLTYYSQSRRNRMRTENRLLYISLCLAALLSFSCCSERRTINGIEVSELLNIVSREQNINYCKLLNKAIKGDDASVRQLALLEIYDGAAYDHGTVLVYLIKLIGEERFIRSLDTINDKQKNRIEGFLSAGLEYSNNPDIQFRTIKEEFPILSDYLGTD